MRKETMKNRRRFNRVACSRFVCSCSVRLEPKSAEPGGEVRRGALLLDISPDGILYETNFRPSVGDMMHIEIRPIEGPEVMATLKVIHAGKSAKNGFYSIGSRFEKISTHDRQGLLTLLDTITRLEDDLSQA